MTALAAAAPDEIFGSPAFGRLAASHIGIFLLARGLRWQQGLAVDRVDTMIVQVTMSAGIAHLPLNDAGLDIADAMKRPVSVHAVSSSMGLPYETTRRRSATLADKGLMRAEANGYFVPATPVICGADQSLVVQDVAALHALLTTMRAQGFDNLPVRPPSHLADDARVGRAIVDFSARCLEGFVEQHGSITAGSIWAAIIAANVRHLLDRPALPPGYTRDRQPLSDLSRCPIPVRQLAREVGLPHETVRRNVVDMARRGAVVLTDQGAIVPAAALKTPQQLARSRSNIAHLRRLFDDVSRLTPSDAAPDG